MRTKLVVALLCVALLVYFGVLGYIGTGMIGTGSWAGVALGIGLLLLPLLGAWSVVRELMFGVATERLGRQLAERGELPGEDELGRTDGGRTVRADGERLFERYKQEVEAAPDDAGAWYRLAIAYDAAGDRKRGRAAARHALRLKAGR